MGSSCIAIQLWWEVPPWVSAVAPINSRRREVGELKGDIVAHAGKSMSWGQPLVQSEGEIMSSVGGERCSKVVVISNVYEKNTTESPWRRDGKRSLTSGQSGNINQGSCLDLIRRVGAYCDGP